MDKKESVDFQKDLINNDLDILERYPNSFFEKQLGEHSYYIEKPLENVSGSFRFFITPSGAVAVSSLIPEEIWSLTGQRDNDIPLLLEVDNIVSETRSLDIHDLVKEMHFCSNTYFLRILPYSDKHTSNIIKCFLDRRYKAK